MDFTKLSKDQLISHLRDKHGINKSMASSKQELLDAVYELEGEPADTEVKPAPKAKAKSGDRPESVRINIAKTETDAGDVFVGVNGTGYQLKRGVDMDVPYRVYEALKNAKALQYQQQDDGSLVETEVLRYPFNVVV